jgi:hypothetical protein
VVHTEAESAPPVVADTLPVVAAEAPDAPEPSKVAEVEEGTSDPFDSDTVDDNREGKHIMKRALMMPKADPPGE